MRNQIKKGLYLIYDELDDKGINKKIKGQIRCFEKHGIMMDKYLMKCRMISGFRIWARLPFTNLLPKWVEIPGIKKYDFIYMRRPGFMSRSFLKFLKSVKKDNPKIIIIMEVPTYPYDKEYIVDRKNIPFLIKDKIARKKISKFIDYISILTEESRVFGVKTIKIINGYEFGQLPARSNYETSEVISIAIVARFQFWHGYERIIEGLHNYYENGGKRMVRLHFVGDGQVIEEYKKLLKGYGLIKNAKFYGFLENDKIMKVYNKCNLAVDCLGAYKKDIYFSCSLKTREYLAVGLPIITGIRLDVQDYKELCPFVLEFENSSVPLEFEKIVTFFDTLYSNNSPEDNKNMIEIIRKNAQKYLDSVNSLNNVISVIESQN